jgi:hypothetical protein
MTMRNLDDLCQQIRSAAFRTIMPPCYVTTGDNRRADFSSRAYHITGHALL